MHWYSLHILEPAQSLYLMLYTPTDRFCYRFVFTIITATVVIVVTIVAFAFAAAGFVIADSDVAIALILIADSVIAGVLVYLLLLWPSLLILFCKKNRFLNLLM